MPFVIREPQADEAETLASLHVAAWQETYTALLPEGFFDAAHHDGRRTQWDRILTGPRPGHVIRVAEHDGTIAGFGWAGPSAGPAGEPLPRDRQLYALYLLRAHHGGGAGQALLESVLGTDPAMLWVAAENPRAIAFYRRNGFAFDGTEHTDPATPLLTEARLIR